MNGNQDIEGIIHDLMIDHYGHSEVYTSGICFDEAIYSDNFIDAIEEGLIPDINRIEKSYNAKGFGEYHHLIFDDECYSVYFK